jgi:predicted NBD/HSP70 family sugar kinase
MLAHEEIRVFSDPERSIATMIEALEAMRARYPHKTFEGIGISVPGRVDPRSNHLILAPNLKCRWSWTTTRTPACSRSCGSGAWAAREMLC